jgi:hypothetical protein
MSRKRSRIGGNGSEAKTGEGEIVVRADRVRKERREVSQADVSGFPVEAQLGTSVLEE